MDNLRIFLTVLLGAVWFNQDGISGSELEPVRPGQNITLHCDCKKSLGVFIVWFRNCSHKNQPSLVLTTKWDLYSVINSSENFLNPFPRFHLVENKSFETFDLLIESVTDSDLGLYYCGTEETKVKDTDKISLRNTYKYGNVATRIFFNSSDPQPPHPVNPDCELCWLLLFTLCPASALLFSLLSILAYHLCRKTAKEPKVHQQPLETTSQTQESQDEDSVCYAALDIRQASQRPKTKKKRSESSDFSTYSAIRTSRM